MARFITADAYAERFLRKKYEGSTPEEVDLHPIRTSLFIESGKLGLQGEEQAESSGLEKGSYEEVPEALKTEEDQDDLPF